MTGVQAVSLLIRSIRVGPSNPSNMIDLSRSTSRSVHQRRASPPPGSLAPSPLFTSCRSGPGEPAVTAGVFSGLPCRSRGSRCRQPCRCPRSWGRTPCC